MGESGRVLITFANGESFETTNPFTIAAEIRRLVGEVEAAKPDAKGSLIITTKNSKQTETLLQQKRFLEKEAIIDCPIRLNSVEAYVYAPSLLEVDEQELITELREQGIIAAYRLRPTRGKPNPGLRLTIIGKTVPTSIRAGFQDIPLRPWRRSPLLCRKCAAYGHTHKYCRADFRRCLRCAEDHLTDDCQSTRNCCPHCGNGHPAWDRRCPILEAHFNKQETPPMKTTIQTEDTGTQTTSPARDAAVTARPHTCSAAVGPELVLDTKTIATQTKKLPVFTGAVTIAEEEEEEAEEEQVDHQAQSSTGRRLRPRTPAQQAVAAVPPAAPLHKATEETPDDHTRAPRRASKTDWWQPPPTPPVKPPTPPIRAVREDWWHR